MRLKLFTGLLPLRWSGVVRDAWAGITLASMDIPQVLGYARIAGMPVVSGLYTVLLPLVVFAIFGSSRHLVVAADSATATILASGLSDLAPLASPKYSALAGMVALLTAVFLLLARIFKLGFLADFLSRTVLVGFLTGVGIQLCIAMSGNMLGFVSSSPHTTEQISFIAQHLSQTNFASLGLSFFIVVTILGCKRYFPRVPMPMIAVLGGITASYFFHFSDHGIRVLGVIPQGLPLLGIPQVSWRELLSLLPIAASCFVMIIAQSAAASRSFAERYHEHFDGNADILGLSAANAVAALSSTFVVNGSPTQTAMADLAGARSQVAQLVFAIMVGIVLLFFTAPLQYLPHCVLASIVFCIAVGLIDIKNMRAIRQESPGEFTLAVVTAASVAIVGVEQGIMLAMVLSLLRHVKHSYTPHTNILMPDATGQWIPLPIKRGCETEPGLIVYRFGADLFFANENRFVNEVRFLIKHAPTPVQWFIVDAGAITDLDYSAAQLIRELCTELTQRGVILIFARVNAYLRADMDRHGITSVIDPKNIYTKFHEALMAIPLGQLKKYHSSQPVI